MLTASLRLNTRTPVAPVNPRLFGSFVEHMGRAVYTGIFEPGHETADARGFRSDVADLVRELGVSIVRYPGGNFVSGFTWEDSVGPVDERPVRLDAAWHSIETNRVGIHEFAAWAASAGVEVMQAVNLGTRGVAEAAELLEYCNIPRGTALSDARRANGADEPFDIRVWCLGNEMDGPWQIGHKTADEYGRLAAETARLMRFVDPRIELVAAGSSNAEMPTFGSWERTVLTHTAGLVDHISVHAYYEELDGDADSFLASAVGLDRYLDEVAQIIDEVRSEAGIERPIGISVDEWNVWYQTRFNEVDKEPLLTGEWNEAPRLIEDEYGVTDAVVVGSLLNSLLRHGDRVSMANLAQLVNVIAPIRSEPAGPAWRQTTFHPFERTARFARGEILAVDVSGAPVVETQKYGAVPVVDAAATRDGDDVVLFLVNRSTTDELALSVEIPDVVGLALVDAETLTVPDGLDRHASNSATEPARVGLVPLAGVEVSSESGAAAAAGSAAVSATLPALSWSIIRLAATAAVETRPAATSDIATSDIATSDIAATGTATSASSSASSPSDSSDGTTSSLGDTRA